MSRTKRLLLVCAWCVSLVLAFFTGVFAYRHRAELRAMFQSVQRGQLIETNLYNLTVEKLSTPAVGRYGAIAAWGDGVLLGGRDGGLWYIDPEHAVRPLQLRVPINVTEFESDPYNERTTQLDNFAVKDLLVRVEGDSTRIFASHNFWDAQRDCHVLRVSGITLPTTDVLDSAATRSARWRTVFDSSPCRELSPRPNDMRGVTIGAGGRLAQFSDESLLVTVGGFGAESESADAAPSQDVSNSYGKTILVDLQTGTARIFTLGHRNPQGLAARSDSAIWLTEHGARGGDELNRLVDGNNYGYPYVSYGTRYESMEWPTNPRQGHHSGFEAAAFAWVPSIGISQLVILDGTAFPAWSGDLLVSSLAARSIFRVSIQGGRPAFVEQIPVEHRIRDIAELRDGTLALKAEDDFLIFLAPVTAASSADAELPAAQRGALLATQCRACHTMQSGEAAAIGPNLWNVVGRPIASADDFAYSAALTALDGRWTPERLRAFLLDPDSVAPGTSMVMPARYDERQIADLIAYLETLQ